MKKLHEGRNYVSTRECFRELGFSTASAAWNWAKDRGIPSIRDGRNLLFDEEAILGRRKAREQVRPETPETDLDGKALELLSSPEGQSAADFCNALELSPARGERLLADLQDRHPGIVKAGDRWRLEDIRYKGPDDETHIIKPEEVHFGRFGVVSDTHFGSKYAQITYLHEFYDECDRVGVDFFLHPGDWCDGSGKVYRGQVFEMFVHGFEGQRDLLVKHYPRPRRTGVRTKGIAGNHDDSLMKLANVNIIKEVAAQRDDIEYLGRDGAYVMLGGDVGKCYLQHPDGGGAYALSYKAQKFIEGFSSENKPQVFLIGHYHCAGQFFIRNIHCFLAGCFQAQTPYERRKGLYPALGGWIVEYELGPDGWSLRTVNARFMPFYKPLEDDWKRWQM
jgi:predicted phosphodiesterase